MWRVKLQYTGFKLAMVRQCFLSGPLQNYDRFVKTMFMRAYHRAGRRTAQVNSVKP